jgi:hypothetical protein
MIIGFATVSHGGDLKLPSIKEIASAEQNSVFKHQKLI